MASMTPWGPSSNDWLISCRPLYFGRWTSVSRGIETRMPRWLLGSTRAMMITSARWPPTARVSPKLLLSEPSSTKARESEPSRRKFSEPAPSWSRSTFTDLAWANFCSSTTVPPARPTAAAVVVTTNASARRQRKTRPDDGEGGGCELTGRRILLPGTSRPRRSGTVPVGWRSVASPADVLLAVLAALPPDADLVVVRREPGQWVLGVEPDARLTASGSEAIDRLDGLDAAGGWWAGWLAYDLGRAVERVEPRRPDDLGPADPGLPDVALARFDARLVLGPSGVRIEGDGPARPLLGAAVRRALSDAGRGPAGDGASAGVSLPPFSSSLDRPGFEDGVRSIVELIRAGDCYQVNLTRRLTSDGRADPRALFGAIVR